MKHTSKLALAMLFLGLAFSCKQANVNEEATSAVAADSTTVISSSAAVDNKDSNRKFVRTADLRFRVKNVAKSTYAIENIITKNGGYVSSTELKSNISEKSETKISEDSLLESTRFTVDNSVTFRVPNTRLDTVLKSLVREIDFLDNRSIKADDVSLQMLSNTLSQRRLNDHQKD